MKQSFLDKSFKDERGRLALTAIPNVPIIIWAVASLGGRAVKHGGLHTILGYIGFVAIIIWAFWELFKGVNYFRRALGLVVMVFALWARFHSNL